MQPRSKGWVKKGIALLGAAACCGVAWGQYVWMDEKGVKQYSDRPPPPSVPANRILKPARNGPAAAAVQPAEPAAGTAASAGGASPAASAAPAGNKPAPSLSDRNADFNKRRAEQAAKDKKAGEQERLAQEKAKNCERAASYKRNLESGARVARVDRNGERSFLTDEQRAQELREAAKLLEGCS
ncbi:DUF4124 domain-containing protein [Lacisediminimonas profundi]|uniref:DUF4124 domain-containing protein n=1 Tax=Lacisediminimonas profundi TaxID=2603856 RepID=UPI00124B9AD7|nr:DUF4124 domain-containing protein [Lacisediminimonas profundi]